MINTRQMFRSRGTPNNLTGRLEGDVATSIASDTLADRSYPHGWNDQKKIATRISDNDFRKIADQFERLIGDKDYTDYATANAIQQGHPLASRSDAVRAFVTMDQWVAEQTELAGNLERHGKDARARAVAIANAAMA